MGYNCNGIGIAELVGGGRVIVYSHPHRVFHLGGRFSLAQADDIFGFCLTNNLSADDFVSMLRGVS